MKLRLLLVLLITLLLCGCSSGSGTGETPVSQAEGKQIVLERFEGNTKVNDGEKDVEAFAGMNLYDGYDVGTEKLSYDWIMLDENRLVKMDQNTKTSISQDGKKLKIFLEEGSLFFCVSDKLAEEEELTFETQNVSLSIRGTCGLISHYDDTTRFIVFEGKVMHYLAGKENGYWVNRNMIYTIRNGESSQGRVYPGGEIGGFVQKEFEENEMVKAKMEDSDFDADLMSDEEVAEALARLVGSYRDVSFTGAKTNDPDLDFYVEDPYTLNISITEDGYLEVDVQATPEARAAIDRYDQICEQKGYDFRFPDDTHHMIVKLFRMEEDGSVFYDVNGRVFGLHPVEGGITTSYSTEPRFVPVS